MPLKGGLVCAAVRQVPSLSSYSVRGDLGPIEMALDLCFWVPAQTALLQEALWEPNFYHQRPEGGFSFIFCWCPLFPQSILYVLTLLLAYWVCVRLLSLFSYFKTILRCHSEISRCCGSNNIIVLVLPVPFSNPGPGGCVAQSWGLSHRQDLLWDKPEFLSNLVCHNFLLKISILF